MELKLYVIESPRVNSGYILCSVFRFLHFIDHLLVMFKDVEVLMPVQCLVCKEPFFCPYCRRDERLELQWSLEGHQLGVVSVDISHTLPIAASSSLDAHIRLWDLENGKQMKSIDAGPGKNSTFRGDARSPESSFRLLG